MSNKQTLPGWARRRLAEQGYTPAHAGRILNRAAPDVDDLTIPSTPAELEELFNDTDRMQRVWADQDKFREFVTNYAKTMIAKDGTIVSQLARQVQDAIQSQIDEKVQASLAEQLKDVAAHGRPPLGGTGGGAKPRNKLYNEKAPGAQIDHLFDSTADFLATIWHLNRDPAAADKLAKLRNDYSSVIPSEGGFLIPETLRSQVLSVALEQSVVRPRAMVVPMDSLRVPFPTIDSTSNASSVHGGITAFWTEESAALTESEAKFGRVVLDAKTLTAYAEVPNQLLTDSIISLAAFFDQKYPEALAWFEDVAFISGSGVGEPLGFLNADAMVSVAKESGQAADTIVWENIVKAYSRMLPSSLGRAVWVCHIDTFPELATMALSVGTGGSAIWLNNGAVGPPVSILGRPVIFTEKASTVGDAGDVNFVDFGYYLVGDRQAMSAMSSPHFKFANNQTAFRVVQRVDGKPWLQSAITPQTGSNTLSAFVNIADRA